MVSVYYKTMAEFSRMCSISRSAITQAVERKEVKVSENGKINPKQRLNAQFLEYKQRQYAEKLLLKAEKEVTKVEKETVAEPVKKKAKPRPRQARTVKIKPDKGELGGEALKKATGTVTKMDVEILRIEAQTTKINMEIAEKSGRFYLKEQVDDVFGKLSATFANLVHPLGQRLASDICDLCEVTEPKIILQVQGIIDVENERAIDEVKRITNEKV